MVHGAKLIDEDTRRRSTEVDLRAETGGLSGA
jgi:hypothetical protein